MPTKAYSSFLCAISAGTLTHGIYHGFCTPLRRASASRKRNNMHGGTLRSSTGEGPSQTDESSEHCAVLFLRNPLGPLLGLAECALATKSSFPKRMVFASLEVNVTIDIIDIASTQT